MKTIQHQPKAIMPCIRPKVAQSSEIDRLVDDFLKRGGKITREVKPSVFKSEFGRKPSIAPVDTAVWTQKADVQKLMSKHKILSGTIARKLKIAPKYMDEFFNGLRYPTVETQERIIKVLDELIVGNGQ